jgi:uncharacterized protein (TIGR02284 family)
MEDIVDQEILDQLKSLHTSEIDARNGYEDALEDAEGKGLTPLFRDMLVLHESNANEISGVLMDAGENAGSDGSFMSVVHRTIMNIRLLFKGLDDSVLPGLIDGESRNVEKYEDALASAELPAPVEQMLTDQCAKLEQKIELMKSQRVVSLQH